MSILVYTECTRAHVRSGDECVRCPMGQHSEDGLTCVNCPPHSDTTQATSYCSVYSFFSFLSKTTVLAMYKLYSSKCDWYYALLNYWSNTQKVDTTRDWNTTLMNQWNRILNKLCSKYKTVCTFVGCIAGYQAPPAHSGPCTACPIGTYKENWGSHQCTNCPEGTSTRSTGSTSADDCGKLRKLMQPTSICTF